MVLEEMIAYLTTLGLGTAGDDIFGNEMPPAPVKCLMVREYGGTNPTRTLGTLGFKTEVPRVQLQSRAETNVAAKTPLITAFAELGKVLNQTISGVRYVRMEPLQSPFYLKRDDNKHPIYVMNVEIEKALS